ncbi:myeloid cell surface antigen CD33-like [Eleutherodactylus coqui]|uniref:myeloid cell surface antigen CD33-like n=1 Tax=Eleutherodactylus coqui TaxID=57060 RepID=UPI003462428A
MRAIATCCLHYKAIILILSLLWRDLETAFINFGDAPNLPGFSVTAPSSITVQAGLCVHIPCRFKLPPIYTLSRETRGIWLRGNALTMKPVAVKISSEVPNRSEKFFLTGDISKGDCSLMINDARQQDEDYYTFRVEDGSSKYTFNSFTTFVKVIELTDKPEISVVGRIVAGKEITLSCTSPGRCSGKAPIIAWKGKATIKTEKVYALGNEDGTTTHQSNVTFVPSFEDDQLVFTCIIIFERDVTTTNSISLNIKDAASTDISMPVCRSVDSKIIVGMVVGNVLILILIIVVTYCFLKRNMEKRPLGNDSQTQVSGTQRTERPYQDLIGQTNDIYYSIRTQ